MGHTCIHLTEFMKLQKEVLIKHLSNHKYYRHIKDENQGVFSFIQEYGFAMREVYCRCCRDKKDCDGYRETLQEEP